MNKPSNTETSLAGAVVALTALSLASGAHANGGRMGDIADRPNPLVRVTDDACREGDVCEVGNSGRVIDIQTHRNHAVVAVQVPAGYEVQTGENPNIRVLDDGAGSQANRVAYVQIPVPDWSDDVPGVVEHTFYVQRANAGRTENQGEAVTVRISRRGIDRSVASADPMAQPPVIEADDVDATSGSHVMGLRAGPAYLHMDTPGRNTGAEVGAFLASGRIADRVRLVAGLSLGHFPDHVARRENSEGEAVQRSVTFPTVGFGAEFVANPGDAVEAYLATGLRGGPMLEAGRANPAVIADVGLGIRARIARQLEISGQGGMGYGFVKGRSPFDAWRFDVGVGRRF